MKFIDKAISKVKYWYDSEVTVNTLWYYALLFLLVLDMLFWFSGVFQL